MEVKVLRAIPGHKTGDVVDLPEALVESYGPSYVEPTVDKKAEKKKAEAEAAAKASTEQKNKAMEPNATK